MSYSISIDWLQTHNVTQCDYDAPGLFGRFMLKNIGRKAHFKDVYEIFTYKVIDDEKIFDERIATLAAHPDRGILKNNSCFLKVDNKFLYNTDLKNLLLELNEALQLTFKNISRIDLACDFHSFLNNLEPENFIDRCIVRTPRYIKMGHGKFYMIGVYGEKQNGYPYIRWGTGKSNLYYYLYDKTLELKEKIDKPWIREKWKADGLDDSQSVWRLEFAIHSCSKGIIDDDDADGWKNYAKRKAALKKVSPEKLKELKKNIEWKKSFRQNTPMFPGQISLKQVNELELLQDEISYVEMYAKNKAELTADAVFFSSLKVLDSFDEVYRALFHRYFDFRLNDGQEKKCRMKPVPLLDLAKPAKLVMNIVDKIESNRTDKINFKALVALNNACRIKDVFQNDDLFEMQKAYDSLQRAVNFFAQQRGESFTTWVKEKFPEEFEKMNVKVRTETSNVKTDYSHLPLSNAAKKALKVSGDSLFLEGKNPF